MNPWEYHIAREIDLTQVVEYDSSTVKQEEGFTLEHLNLENLVSNIEKSTLISFSRDKSKIYASQGFILPLSSSASTGKKSIEGYDLIAVPALQSRSDFPGIQAEYQFELKLRNYKHPTHRQSDLFEAPVGGRGISRKEGIIGEVSYKGPNGLKGIEMIDGALKIIHKHREEFDLRDFKAYDVGPENFDLNVFQ